MRKLFFYPSLAAKNIKNNGRFYFPFIIASSLTVSMFFIIYSLSENTSLSKAFAGDQMRIILSLAMIVASFFFVVFLFYTQSFLIKRRTKEFGIYSVLGMGKKNICLASFFETLYVLVISLVGGIAFGALMSKLSFMAFLKIIHMNSLEFSINSKAIIVTVSVFIGIFILMFLNTVRQIMTKKDVELLAGGSVGEKEPKTKIITTIIGVLTLGTGYYLALTTESPLQALGIFVVAVILVMIGTYCIFTAGSISLLKLLRKNKNYYYKTNHFVSTSGMMYRMKQNAVGLANICIICTAVLVMISTTASLYFGMEDVLRTRYPRNITVSVVSDKLSESEQKEIPELAIATADKAKVNMKNVISLKEFSVATINRDGVFVGSPEDSDYSASQITSFHFVSLDDYNKMTGSTKTLKKDEVIVSQTRGKLTSDELNFNGYKLKIKEFTDNYDIQTRSLAYMMDTYYVVVPDFSYAKEINFALNGTKKIKTTIEYSFDTDAESETQIELFNSLKKSFSDKSYYKNCTIENAEEAREDFYSIYGVLFFIGIFLGLVFMLAAVLIIYYKQISEGFEDKKRFEIMQKVGMDKRDIKKSIHSQVLTVFFMPLGMAFVHLAFAFPVITKLLNLLNLTHISVFVIGLVITAVVFSAIYAVVYALTSKAYYRIVSRQE